jgi:hypothetical protein
MGKWKAVRKGLKRGDLTVELYDMDTDSAESQDVAAEHPEVVLLMERIMAQEHVPSSVFPLATIDPS